MKNETKRGLRGVCAAGLLAASAVAALGGCGGGSGGDDPGIVFATPEKYRETVSLAGGAVPGSGTAGVFVEGRSVTLRPFRMAKYETTWQLWKEVYDWAIGRGYTFTNAGKEGYPYAGSSDEGRGTDDPTQWTAAQRKSRPVTEINWWDAIVWCNAYSEMSGKEPVYYTDAGYTTVLKVSTDDSKTTTAVMKSGANGYRLPTEAEWEYAARGGNTAAAAWSYTYAGTNAEQLGDYVWYAPNAYTPRNTSKEYGAHPVGTKTGNGAGLYDMSGNVWEWCWDWFAFSVNTAAVTDPVWAGDPAGPASGSNRVGRGGSWYYFAGICTVSIRYYYTPIGRSYDLGFRVVAP
ncbi:MAG: formylglycine-generating enzyme family protein [Treponema sp.]|jgi:formylglycine-generating enzyme required for sulfatase activity|nr:formylglycine-generating enzyme family protein [Treponema sp.]